MHKYVIMGPQGCGKGTQAQRLEKHLDLVHINVGRIFRWNIEAHTKLGARIKRIVAFGQLVSDEIVEAVVRRRLEEHDWNFGFILDGFPRNRVQTEFFLESYDIDAVLYISVPDHVVLQRLLARRLCSACGLDYNLLYHPPAADNACDVCGGTLIAREDDNEGAIAARLRDYHRATEPVLGMFRRKDLVIEVDGTQSPDAVQKAIRQRLNLG